jgi:hypothetical protein
VTPDAVATLVVGQDYLAWAMEPYAKAGHGVLINSTALGEFTFEFCRAYLMILEMSEPRPSNASFRVGLYRALEPEPLRLGAGKPDSLNFSHSARAAPSDEFVETVENSASRRTLKRLLRCSCDGSTLASAWGERRSRT